MSFHTASAHKMVWKIIAIFCESCLFRNTAKNAGRSRENSGLRERQKMHDFPHDLGASTLIRDVTEYLLEEDPPVHRW